MSLEAQIPGVEQMLRDGPRYYHSLLEQSCLPRDTFNQVLGSMKLQGIIEKRGDKYHLNGGTHK